MDGGFLEAWHTAAITSVGLFWMAFWAFGLGYLISSMIQVFATRERMRRAMGEAGPKSVALGSVFGFASSSCSFAALSTTRALFAKGAGLIPALAFLLASTNLVVELGVVIAIFLGWQFVVGEYAGGVLLIALVWLFVRATYPKRLVEKARERARMKQDGAEDNEPPDWKRLARSTEGWRRVSKRYVMEWAMVWKDVAIGFTAAGIIAAFVPQSWFAALFASVGVDEPAAWRIALDALVGPVAAFFTFIGSMGNIPLAAVLFGNGVSFAGVMAFIFSDLVVFPVLRIQAAYYGWRMALYILAVFLAALVAAALLLHAAFGALGVLPDPAAAENVTERSFFTVDYTLALNVGFIAASAAMLGWAIKSSGFGVALPRSTLERVLLGLVALAFAWLAGGLVFPLLF